jgi:hypothetical protein
MKHFFKTSAKNNRKLFLFEKNAPVRALGRIPELRGSAIEVAYLPKLTAWRGQLLSKSHKGDAVYAGCFIRKRRMVLDQSMLRTPRVLERIFVHEVFHFVWSKLDRETRASFEKLVRREMRLGATGELGWSAESMKLRLAPSDRRERTRRWKDYVCESFCDTAGWFFGTAKRYAEMTLDPVARAARREWVRQNLVGKPLSI